MTVESVTHISDLNVSYPGATDAKSEGDDHIRNLKVALKTDLPNITGPVTATQAELNRVVGVTSAIQTQLDAKAPKDSPVITTAATLPAATTVGAVTAAEILRLSGVTSAIQAQIDAKAPLASPTLTGVPLAPTAAAGTSTTQLATTAFVQGAVGWVLLSTVTASGAATADVDTTFDATYDAYVIVATNVTASTSSATLQARMKLGGAYASTGYSSHVAQPNSSSASYSGVAVANQAQLAIATSIASNGAADSLEFVLFVHNPASTSKAKHAHWLGSAVQTAGNFSWISGAGGNTATTALTGIRFFPATGTLSGTFRLYGIRNT
jgi:hypothetical protein